MFFYLALNSCGTIRDGQCTHEKLLQLRNEFEGIGSDQSVEAHLTEGPFIDQSNLDTLTAESETVLAEDSQPTDTNAYLFPTP